MTNDEKIFVIGDIHGQLRMLENLMARIPWRPEKDTLVFLGDYVDRGPNPRGVIDYLISLTAEYSKITCVLGNHEGMLLDYLDGINKELYLANGGGSTLRAYERRRAFLGNLFIDEDIPDAHTAFYKSLKPYAETDGYYMIHAGFRPGIPLAGQSTTDMLWIREPFISSTHDFGKRVVFGHTPFQEPLVMDNKIGIDTGAAYGMRLCCLELPTEKFYFASD